MLGVRDEWSIQSWLTGPRTQCPGLPAKDPPAMFGIRFIIEFSSGHKVHLLSMWHGCHTALQKHNTASATRSIEYLAQQVHIKNAFKYFCGLVIIVLKLQKIRIKLTLIGLSHNSRDSAGSERDLPFLKKNCDDHCWNDRTLQTVNYHEVSQNNIS